LSFVISVALALYGNYLNSRCKKFCYLLLIRPDLISTNCVTVALITGTAPRIVSIQDLPQSFKISTLSDRMDAKQAEAIRNHDIDLVC